MSDLYRLSDTILDHFSESGPQGRRNELVTPARRGEIQAVCEAAFWASLRRDEGRSPKISLAFLPPEHTDTPLLFASSIPITPEALTRLAPAVARPGIHLGAWDSNGSMCLWGTTRSLPSASFVLEVSSPGVLVVKQSPDQEFGKYSNIAVLDGQSLRVIHRAKRGITDRTRLAAAFVGPEYCSDCGEPAELLVELAAAMQSHGHGGTVLIVPQRGEWRESISEPIPYFVSPAFSELANVASDVWPSDDDILRKQRALDVVEMVAGLTAVDGATILSKRYDVLAFGAKIRRREGFTPVQEVIVTEPVEGAVPHLVNPEELGGTRHRSAAQFVNDQRNAVALVSSQDGKFTTFAWSGSDNAVRARRVELLLL